MTADELRSDFANAFITQGRSDWLVYRVLTERPDVALCHQLHYLQMACEKLAKAYRLRDTGSPVEELVSKHSGLSKFVSAFFLAVLKPEYPGKEEQLTKLLGGATTLAREIEKLAPAIDRSSAPENAEYPWERYGKVVAPCNYHFPSLDLLKKPSGRAFLKLVERAFNDFESVTLP